MRNIRNIFTVDLEEWFHVCGVAALGPGHWDELPSRVDVTTNLLLELLDAVGVRATVFVVGWVADHHPELVKKIHRAGHEIGSHGHAHERAYDLGRDGFRADIRASVASLAAVGVPRVSLFRAPEWSINDQSPWGLAVLAEEGFRVDSSMAPVKIVGRTSYPRAVHIRSTSTGNIVEVPPLVCDRFGQVMPIGWGWALRMSPPARVRRTIESVNRAGHPAVLTVHPWELDPDPPRVRLPARLHFAHYFKLTGFRQRLREILSGTPFGPIGEIAAISPSA